MKILVMSSRFLTLSFSSVTVGILGAEQKDHTNSGSEITFSSSWFIFFHIRTRM